MDDLIRRADAITAVWECYEYTESKKVPYKVEAIALVDALQTTLSTIPSADAMSEWIPCSERMPEFSTEVLVTMEWGDRHVMSVEWDSQTNELAWEDTIQNFRWDFDNVIAWMPLPKPYEEVKEDE